jgi:hypothetical protein
MKRNSDVLIENTRIGAGFTHLSRLRQTANSFDVETTPRSAETNQSPVPDRTDAALIAENVRAAIEHREIQHALSSVGPHVAGSSGAATVAPVMTDRVEKLVCLADVARYGAKRAAEIKSALSLTARPAPSPDTIQPRA